MQLAAAATQVEVAGHVSTVLFEADAPLLLLFLSTWEASLQLVHVRRRHSVAE